MPTESSSAGSRTGSPRNIPSSSTPSSPSPDQEGMPSPPRPTPISQPSSTKSDDVSTMTQEDHDLSNCQMPASADESNLIDMPNWQAHLNSDEIFDISYLLRGEFNPDLDAHPLDGELSMSEFIMSTDFNLNTPMDDETMSDNAFCKTCSHHMLSFYFKFLWYFLNREQVLKTP
ncbi:MAG: hypothetical protein M1818_005160 [Claussenomyces sp. TS43310]|nr:MAG: hypothetical protein M1818_005160 [Claussenomyces sp. TS43310]